MSDDSSQSGSNRGRRVLRAVRRRLKRVEIETHLIRADLAQFEAVQETGLAEATRLRARTSTERNPSSTPYELRSFHRLAASEFPTAPAPSQVVRVDLRPKRQQATKRGASDVDFSAIPTRIDTESVPRKRGIARWVSPAWFTSVVVHFALLLACGSLTYAILIDDTPPRSITLDLGSDSTVAMSETAITEVVEKVEADSPDLATGDGPMNLADVAIADPLPLTTDATVEPIQGLRRTQCTADRNGHADGWPRHRRQAGPRDNRLRRRQPRGRRWRSWSRRQSRADARKRIPPISSAPRLSAIALCSSSTTPAA